MKLLDDKEKDIYTGLIEGVCETYIEETFGIAKELGGKLPDLDTIRAIGTANGQVVFDKVIEMTEHMSKQEVVKYLAACIESESLRLMVENREFFLSMAMRVMIKKWGQGPK